MVKKIMKPQQKMQAKDREQQILSASLTVAETAGYNRVTLDQIAKAAGVSKALPLAYFGTMNGWRRKVMREAIRRRNLRVVAQGLAAGDPHAKKAPDDLKAAALASCA
jgi:AcrR family transcriptional regulator